MQAPPEQLGSFYLGAEYDLKKRKILSNTINYDARDLTTHAICVGMTGSGKTGLCIGLLEEAALDRVPALLIDPKGDITNMLLQFPELKPEDFLPWVNPDDARRKGKTLEEYAKYVSDLWRNGLAEWGIGSERIRKLKESADFTIYTPGSDTGFPVSILSSLTAPGLDFNENIESIRDKIKGTVSALMELVGIEADPIRSREAILLSTVFEYYWSRNDDLDLKKLIMAIQNPPIRQLGVFDVDTFYPEKERFELAMTFNSLIASSSFQSWMIGEPLDIDRMLYTSDGKPRHSIFYIAHLSNRERMFFVTLLLENILMWVRRQSGTTSLRALLYFDEVFGFFPPVAEPPSKRPLLTLLKQARAFGLGVLLVTQNPVDIDYKGLANTGTWFIGKLQTEQDKDRVLHGLKDAISSVGGSGEKIDYDTLISKLSSRIFLMHNIHEDQPITLHTRWVMSYLRGPLTRPQIKQLKDTQKHKKDIVKIKPRTQIPLQTHPASLDVSLSHPTDLLSNPPVLDPSITQIFLPIERKETEARHQIIQQAGVVEFIDKTSLIYKPAILGGTMIRYADRKYKIDEKIENIFLSLLNDDLPGVNWEEADRLPIRISDLSKVEEQIHPDYGPFFLPVPEKANSSREIQKIEKDLSDWVYINSQLTIKGHEDLKIFQQSAENEREFSIRLRQAARERRDLEIDKLEEKYEKHLNKIKKKQQKLERDLIADEAEYKARKREEMVGIGGTALSFFLGRRSTSSVTSIARRRRMTSKAKLKMEETEDEILEIKKDRADVESELKHAIDEITLKWNKIEDDVIIEEIKPRRADVKVYLIALAWVPFWRITYKSGTETIISTLPAYSSEINRENRSQLR